MAAALPLTSSGKLEENNMQVLLVICHVTNRISCKWKVSDSLPLEAHPVFLEASVTTIKHDTLPPSADVSL